MSGNGGVEAGAWVPARGELAQKAEPLAQRDLVLAPVRDQVADHVQGHGKAARLAAG